MGNKNKNKSKAKELPSNEICDGDSADDKELEDENDPNDDIADDNGFVKQWLVQEKAQIANITEEAKPKSLAQTKSKAQELPSNEICDGDEADDKELEDENDPNDDIVDDNGFVKQWLVQLDSENGKKPSKHHKKAKKHHKKAAKKVTKAKKDKKAKKAKKTKRSKSMDALQLQEPYSDQLANGDKDDDKSIHEEEDMKDDVVDYNGHTNAGYGSMNPHTFRSINHIMPGSHITVPRALAEK